jgi:hypothetical protein
MHQKVEVGYDEFEPDISDYLISKVGALLKYFDQIESQTNP